MGPKTKNQVIILLSFFTILFCVVIAYDLIPYLRGPAPYPPDWQWDYLFINTWGKIWVPVLCMIVFLFLAGFSERKSEKYLQQHEKMLLVLFVLIFLCIQLSVTYFSRAGIGVLFARIANPDMNGYFTAANSIESIPLFLRNFNQQVLSLPMHAQGHPPGAILFFRIIEHSIRPFSPFVAFVGSWHIATDDVAVLWKGLTLSEKVAALFSAVCIPFLSTLSCVFVYYIGKFLYGVRVGTRALMILITIPSLVLFIPINDVFLPLFVLSSFLCFIKGIEGEKKFLLFVSGCIFSLGLFFSISLVPLLFIFLVYLLWIGKVKKILMDGTYFSLGIFSLPVVLFVFFGYNTVLVSQTLLQGLPESREYLTWVFFNLSDFFIFLGIPLFILFCFVILNLFQDLFNLAKSDKIRLDPLLLGFLGMLLILDISGTVRGEVARIWIPFYPFLAIILAMVMTKKWKIKEHIFLFILVLQCVQILFMQEFWVMLW